MNACSAAVLSFLLVAAALWHRSSRVSKPCDTTVKLGELEAALNSRLDSALEPLRKENAALRAQLQTRPTVASSAATAVQIVPSMAYECAGTACSTPLAVASPPPFARSPAPEAACGLGAGAVLQQSRLYWKNRHGRFMRRTITLRANSLAICKRERTPEKEISLDSSMSVLSGGQVDGVHRIRLRSASGEALAVLGAESEVERQAWLRALGGLLPGGPPAAPRGTAEAGRAPTTAVAAPSVPAEAQPTASTSDTSRPTARASPVRAVPDPAETAELVRRRAACQQHAVALGAHSLHHQAQPLAVVRRGQFAANCAVASGRVGREALPFPGEATGEPRPAIPRPRESDSRFLLVDRSFTHGLGHEVGRRPVAQGGSSL